MICFPCTQTTKLPNSFLLLRKEKSYEEDLIALFFVVRLIGGYFAIYYCKQDHTVHHHNVRFRIILLRLSTQM
jgi:hypothetical protein